MKGCICKRTYHRTRGIILQDRAEQVITAVYKYTDYFVNPPITKKVARKILADYISKRIVHDQGGTGQNQPYVAARKALIKMIDDFADYVDIVANHNRAIIKLAGFLVSYDPIKIKFKRKPDNIMRLTLERYKNISGSLIANCEKYPPRTSFIGFLFEGSPIPEGVDFFKNGHFHFPKGLGISLLILPHGRRKRVIDELIPGVVYYLYYMAVNNHGLSDLCGPVSIMCC